MAGYYQLLLLVERGTSASAFARLQTYLDQASYPIAPAILHSSKGGIWGLTDEEGFGRALAEAETDYSAEIERQRALGEWVSLPLAGADFRLGGDELTKVTLHISLEPYEVYLLFPRLYDQFSLLSVSVHSTEAELVRDEKRPQDQTLAHRVLEVIDCFEPFYGFQALDETVYSRVVWYHDMKEEQRREYRKAFQQRPWGVYNQTMIFGRTLVEQLGRPHLLAAPAMHTLELPNTVSLWGPLGLLGADEITPAYLAHDFDLERRFLTDYSGMLAEYLGVSLEH